MWSSSETVWPPVYLDRTTTVGIKLLVNDLASVTSTSKQELWVVTVCRLCDGDLEADWDHRVKIFKALVYFTTWSGVGPLVRLQIRSASFTMRATG